MAAKVFYSVGIVQVTLSMCKLSIPPFCCSLSFSLALASVSLAFSMSNFRISTSASASCIA